MDTTLAQRIRTLHASGLSYRQIQVKLGCSKGTIAYYLGVGVKAKQFDRQRDKRNKLCRFIQEYKSGKACADCHEVYPYWMLDFDHRSNKQFNVSWFRNTTTKLETVMTEIAKCDIVCANCHRNRTFHRLLKTGNSIHLGEM